jgi:pilus assembly protein Flp/PilA
MGSNDSSGRDRRRFSGDSGASLVEYALLVALIAVVCLASLTYFQKETSTSLSKSSSAING